MGRDLTPREIYLLEQRDIAAGRGSLWDFMAGLRFVSADESSYLYSEDDLARRKEFPFLGKLYDRFPVLYERMTEFEGGLEFLKQKDAELMAFVEQGVGDRNSYLVKWYLGELDQGFYYSERNDEMLLQCLCEEAARTMSNWIITDPDCLQVRRQVGFEDKGIYQLMQVDVYGFEEDGDAEFHLAWAEIDFDDYEAGYIRDVLQGYGYDRFKDLVGAVGSREEAYGQLAEMLFETESAECYVQEFISWNDALTEIECRTGLDLRRLRDSRFITRQEQGLVDCIISDAVPRSDLQGIDVSGLKDRDWFKD